MKYSKLRTLIPTAICVSTLIALTSFTGCTESFKESQQKAQDYFSKNQTFDIEKVDSMIDYWGGDSRYVEQSFNTYTFQYNKIYNHFKNKNGEPIIVHYSDTFEPDQQVQFDYVFNYLNSVFEVINPNYTFIAQSGTKANCDIYIEFTDIKKLVNTTEEVLACTMLKHDSFHNSQIASAEIYFDKNATVSKSYKRLALMHEMMHVLYGSGDINEYASQTFSLYNYMDVAYMSRVLTSSSTELQDSFTFMMPTDLSTLISLYGDNTKDENKLAYLDLLNNTLNKCKEVFGNRQPYYEDGYSLPTKESIENTTSTQSFSYSPNLTNSYYKEDGANSQL